MLKMLIMDVDGTLTDGKIYIGNSGEVFKVFSVKDGLGIKKLYKNGIVPVILTGRESNIVMIRAQELDVKEVLQNYRNKVDALQYLCEKYSIYPSQIAIIGDDENDYEIMTKCGFKACPQDACKKVKEICNFVSNYNGGYGAVREVIDYIIEKQ